MSPKIFSHLGHFNRVGIFLGFWGLLMHALGYSPASLSFDASMVLGLTVVLLHFDFTTEKRGEPRFEF